MAKAGKFLALVLKHKPEAIGLTFDDRGRARIPELLIIKLFDK